MIQKILDLLNKDLSLEYAAAIQYIQHYGAMTGPEYIYIRNEVGSHAKDELGHALTLSDLIAYYEGTPIADVGKVNLAKDVKRMLEFDLAAEDVAINRYRMRIKQCEEAGFYELGTALRSILSDELDHANELKLALGK